MKKRIFIVLIILCMVASAIYAYLNEVFFPVKIKDLIIKGLEGSTRKDVDLRSVKLNIFKGLVLRDLVIYEDNVAIINSKEISCGILILPLFRKNIMFSSLRFSSPEIFIKRRADGSLNILDLFSWLQAQTSGFNVVVNRVGIKDARIYFHDDTLAPAFTSQMKDVDADLHLSLPLKIGFDVRSIPGLIMSGEYRLMEKELAAKIAVKGVYPQEFARYYEGLGLSIQEGALDCIADLTANEAVMNADLIMDTKDIVLFKDLVIGKLNSEVKANIQYNIQDKLFKCSGILDVRDLGISGVKDVKRIDNIKGRVEFDNSHLSAERITAETLGFPIEAKINLVNFEDPLFDIYLVSDVDLSALRTVLKDNFNITIPADIQGRGKLNLAMQYATPQYTLSRLNGHLKTHGADIAIRKDEKFMEEVSGEVHFTPNQLIWNELDFKYRGADYKTSGTLTNFDSAGVVMQLYSEDLTLESAFALSGKRIKFSRLEGQYANSDFSVIGDVDLEEADKIGAEIKGALDIDLDDVKERLKKNRDRWERIKPAGRVRADFSLKGNIRDIKSCLIDAELTSASLSLHDLKPDRFFMKYSQANGIAEMRAMHSSLYGGTIDASGRMGLASKGLPYRVNADIKGILIERWKTDTALKDKDISGIVHAKARLSGALDDLSSLMGAGKISITDGKLWQLNLFRGLGLLLFTSDFQNVIFKEGSCNFVIKDKVIFMDDLALRSDLINMYGTVTLDFDKSINSTLKAEITDEALGSGARKNITTAIERYSLIDISGTLKEPKYKFKADVGSIFEDLKNRIFN